MNHWGYVIEQLNRVDERAVELARQRLRRSQSRTTARPEPATPDLVRQPQKPVLAGSESERDDVAA